MEYRNVREQVTDRIREEIPSGALFASTAGSTAPVYSGMPEDLSSCEGLSLPVGKVRLTLGMNKAAGQTFNLTQIHLTRLEKTAEPRQ